MAGFKVTPLEISHYSFTFQHGWAFLEYTQMSCGYKPSTAAPAATLGWGGYPLASVQDVAETLNQINVMSIPMGPKVIQTL